MDELKKLLDQLFPDIDFQSEKALIDDGILDSLDIVSLVNELNDTFDIRITAKNLEPANFNSIDAILRLIESLKG